MYNEPDIDIVVAVHNGEKYLINCFYSLFKTKYENKRIIFVNDGSIDNTLKIMNRLKNEHGDLIEIISKSQGGVSSARNAGIKYSRADFIATTDVDCEVHPNWLTESMSHFKDNKVAAVTGWLNYKVSNILSAVKQAEYFVRFSNRDRTALSVSCPVCIFRREALLDIGGFDIFFKVGGEDTEIGYRLIQKGYKIIYEKNMVVYHSPEEKLLLYLKRNFRNAFNHILLMKERKFLGSLKDEFFSFNLRMQPFYTLGLFLSLLLNFRIANMLLISAICGFFIIYNFFPVIKKTMQIKGLLSIFVSFFYLSLRNVIWMVALVAGGIKSFRR